MFKSVLVSPSSTISLPTRWLLWLLQSVTIMGLELQDINIINAMKFIDLRTIHQSKLASTSMDPEQ